MIDKEAQMEPMRINNEAPNSSSGGSYVLGDFDDPCEDPCEPEEEKSLIEKFEDFLISF